MIHSLEDIVTLDYETYYAGDYSLSLKAYNTSSYVRDPQFKAQCIGISDGTKEAVWYGPDEIGKALKKHAVATRPIAAHNTQFDGFILSDRYDIVPPFYYDTMAMTAALHGHAVKHSLDAVAKLYDLGAKGHGLLKTRGIRDLPPELLEALGDYCCDDTDLCRMILAIQLKAMPDKELRLIDWSIRAFCDPVLTVNQALVKEEYDEQVANKTAKQEAAGLDATTLMSDPQLALALEALGVAVPLKISPKTGKLVPAFSKQDRIFTDLLEHDDDRVVALVEARLATKSTIGESRAKRFMDIGERKLPMGYKYAAAHTLRFGGNNKMNVQNLQRQGYLEDKSPDLKTARLRRSIQAPPDHVIVVCDSAQIEPRTNAWLWDQKELVQAYADGKDAYKMQASRTYGKPEDTISKTERFVGKVQIIGLGYGMGADKFRATLAAGIFGPPLHVSEEDALAWVQAYRKSNDKIVAGWDFCEKIMLDMCLGRSGEYKCLAWERDHIWGPSGLPLVYTGMRGKEVVNRRGESTFGDFNYVSQKNGARSMIWGGTLTENLIQHITRCVIADQKLMTIDAGWRVVGTTHDELIAIAHKSRADACLDDMMKIMRTVPAYVKGTPLNAEGGYDVCYSK